MRTEKAEGPQEPGKDRKPRVSGARPRRGGDNGPLGFGNVMRDVRGGRPGASRDGSGGAAAGTPGDGNPIATGANVNLTMPSMAGFLQSAQLNAPVDAGARAAAEMGAVPTGEQLVDEATFGVRSATEALAAQDRSVTHQANVQPHVPTPLGRMTPAALLDSVLDESTKLEIAAAMKELHVELEPEDLGPVVVRLRKGPDGTLDISFRARQGDAARVLEAGSELLRDRLATAGFASVAIDVSHDAELRLTGRTT